MVKYTVRINQLGSGEQIKMTHHDSLESAIYVVKQFVKTGNFASTIWQYDEKRIMR